MSSQSFRDRPLRNECLAVYAVGLCASEQSTLLPILRLGELTRVMLLLELQRVK